MNKLGDFKVMSAAIILMAAVFAYFDFLFSSAALVSLYFFTAALLLFRFSVNFQSDNRGKVRALGYLALFHFLLFMLSLPWSQNWLGNLVNYLLVASGISVISILFTLMQKLIEQSGKNAEQIATLTKQLTIEKSLFETQLQENQEELESKVQERTLELHIALQELEELNRELAEKSTLDELTGLYNRRFYDQKILAEYRRSRRNLSPLSLVVVDIDHFKKVNDNFGHLAGDECLKAVAQALKKSLLRSTDIACRYGGEEFCLILPETKDAGAKLFAEELRKKISQLAVQHSGQTIALTISCGISTYQQQEGASPETIFSAADQALYQAKQAGRNCVVSADPILLKRIEEE